MYLYFNDHTVSVRIEIQRGVQGFQIRETMPETRRLNLNLDDGRGERMKRWSPNLDEQVESQEG